MLISGIVKRGDKLNGKAEMVNEILKASCQSRNIGFINHDNITRDDLNLSKLHLNKRGAEKLSSDFLNYLSKI